MKCNMKALIMKHLALTCLLIAHLPTYAQQEEKPRTCRIIFPERPQNAPTEAYIFDGQISQKVLLPSLNFSQVIELPQGKITIGMTPDPVSDPETFPEGAPTVSFTASQTDLYLLIYSDPKNKVLPIRIQPISIDSSSRYLLTV